MSLMPNRAGKSVLKIALLVFLFVGILALTVLGGTDSAGAVIFLLGFILFVYGIKRKKIFRALGGMFAAFAGIILVFGTWFESEFPFSPTLWLASHTAVNGTNMLELVRVRSGHACTDEHWHHC